MSCMKQRGSKQSPDVPLPNRPSVCICLVGLVWCLILKHLGFISSLMCNVGLCHLSSLVLVLGQEHNSVQWGQMP